MTIVLAVDGGGSKTHLAICDESGAVLGAATAGGPVYRVIGPRVRRSSIGRSPASWCWARASPG